MNADEILHCGECDGAAVIHEVTPTYTVLAHVRTPATIHPVRLARTTDERSTSQAGLAVSGDIRRSSEGSERPVSPAERDAKAALSYSAGLGSGPSSDPAPVVAGRPRARGVHAGSTSVSRLPRERASQSVPAPFRTVTPRVPSAAGRRP
jgi:hypothetical protein